MKKTIFTILILAAVLLVSGCNLSSNMSKSSDSEMQTEIAQLLTSMVTETATPEPSNTPTLEPTKEPTQLPVVLVTATPETIPTSEEVLPILDITPSEGEFELLTFTPTTSDGSDEVDATDTPEGGNTGDSTPEENDPSLGMGDPTYEDSFDNGDNWSLGKDYYMDLRVSDGNLVMRGLSSTTGWRITNKTLANGYIEMTGKMVDCSGIDNFGIYFRVPNGRTASSGYLYGISCDGQFSLRKWDGEDMTSIIYWKKADAINKGSNKLNRLGVMLDGDHISLYVNGEKVGSASDDDYGMGYVGIFIGAKETHDLTVMWDDLAIWKK
jgi:hypothetical protein